MTTGLWAAGLLDNDSLRKEPTSRFLSSFPSVWNHFIGVILQDFLTREELQNINGEPNEILGSIKERRAYLEILKDIPARSKMQITYLWGFSEVFNVSDKEFLVQFERWKKALEEGNLDHRSFLFNEGLKRLERAYNAVRRGKRPPDLRVCYESWTLLDLHKYHPRGKDPQFYEELLTQVRKRKPENQRLYRRTD
jgi:hypothetical protein